MDNKTGVGGDVINKPSGGGSISGMGEKFSPDLFTGTGNFSVPIALPPGRNGFQPQLGLGYSSGNGGSPFGLGWQLSIPGVSRKTSKGVPVYDNAVDVFILSGAEDLIPVVDPLTPSGAQAYRPRTEGLFAKIYYYNQGNNNYWEVRSKDGLISYYGTPNSANNPSTYNDPATCADPAYKTKVFQWYLTKTIDLFGNVIEYDYERVNIAVDGHLSDMVYLSNVRYADYMEGEERKFMCSVKLNYEERPDPFSFYKQGFEIRVTKRCTKIEVYTHPEAEEVLTKTYYFDYLDSLVAEGIRSASLLPPNRLSLLDRVRITGHDGEAVEGMPPLEFSYTRFDPSQRNFDPVRGSELPPASLANGDYELADLFGNGLPDIFQLNTNLGIARYWRNTGNGRFDAPRLMKDAPAGVDLADPAVQLMDTTGNGKLDLVVGMSGGQNGTSRVQAGLPTVQAGYFPLQHNGLWNKSSFQPYSSIPSFSLSDPEVKLLDLDGDGITDVLRNGSRLENFFNDPVYGFYKVTTTEKQQLDDFPNISFADPRIRVADMSGDGMQDIVFVGDGRIEYWPNLGHGKWGKRVRMGGAPRLPYRFNPAQLLIGDVDGDGLSDLIYVEDTKITLWLNRGGNSWNDGIVIQGTPPLRDMQAVRLVDLYGSGVAGILWTYDATFNPNRERMYFLDFTGGVKPYVLAEMNNNMGAITRVQYKPSTYYYTRDLSPRVSGITDPNEIGTLPNGQRTPWMTTLPFPVQVVAKVEVIDTLSGGKLITEYSYHHGYWDGVEREFRGFGRVHQRDTESFSQYNAPNLPIVPGINVNSNKVAVQYYSAPTESINWFHLGPIEKPDALRNGDWVEADFTKEYWSGDPNVLQRPGSLTAMLEQLPRRARRDAYRALRGSLLRSELYARDGNARQNRPYTVSENLQGVRTESIYTGAPDKGVYKTDTIKGKPTATAIYGPGDNNKQGSGYGFFAFGMASRTSQWERGEEPLTSFAFTENYDAYGIPLVQIGFAVPRGKNPLTGAGSGNYLATCSTSVVIHKNTSTHYLIGRVASQKAYEVLNGGTTSVFALRDVVLQELQSPDTSAVLQLLAFSLSYYDGDAFSGLPYGQIGDYGIAVRSESLVFDNDLLTTIYGSERPPYILSSGSPVWTSDYPTAFRTDTPANAGYVYFNGSDGIHIAGYYASSQRSKYDFQVDPVTAKGMVLQMQDALGNTASITYDDYTLLPVEVTDPAGMRVTADYDYRVMQAWQVTEPNGNRVQFAFSPLGFVTKTAVMGKVDDLPPQGDTLEHPTTRMEYDFFAYVNNKQPVYVKTIAREYHYYPDEMNNDTIISVQYSDGFGRVIQSRAQCEQVIFGDSLYGSSGLVVSGSDGDAIGVENTSEENLNVIVSGWQVYDNKGRVVEKYEPFYDTGFSYKAPGTDIAGAQAANRSKKVQMFYDPRGQVIKTVNPDGTQQRVIFGIPLALDNPGVFTPTPWESYMYDPNDLGEMSHPGDTSVPSEHHYTPSSAVIDALGRTVKTVDRNYKAAAIEEIVMQYVYDIRGNLITVTDPYDRTVFTYFYDYANRNLKTEHIDAGTKFLVPDVLSRPIEARDSKGSLVLSAYDELSRPTKGWCRDNSEEEVTLRSKTIFGDAAGLPDPQGDNLLGKPYKVYDEAGLTTHSLYDFKGNLLEKNRKVIKDDVLLSVFDGLPTDWEVTPYRVDWTTATDSILEGDYQTSMQYDALNRIRTMYYPQDLDSERKQLLPSYDKSGALCSVSLDGISYIERIAYNAKGQRLLVAYGNGIMTRYLYREDNFRLLRMKSEGYVKDGWTYEKQSGTIKQNYTYQYDLSGNIISISDTTPGCGVAGSDELVREFEYDALYRLLSATGRENANTASLPWLDTYRSADPTLTRAYAQTYEYDKLGNIQSLQHVATGGNFTREFNYNTPFVNNKLVSIEIGSNTYNFSYDVNGNMTSEGDTARHMEYDWADRLRSFFVQTGTAEPSKYTQYLYDSSGQRVKKITRKQGGGYSSTCYIDGIFEYTKETSTFDAIPNLEIGTWVIGSYSSGGEQNILHIMGGATRRIGDSLGDSTPAIKFALTDQLGSSNLLVDDVGTNVNREEYYPFGETSFGSYAKKRYRFCGKERDEESGLYYYGMRYYSAWTCRFISVDPMAASYPMKTPYHYCSNNPINYIDPTGAEDQPSNAPPDTNANQQSITPNGYTTREGQNGINVVIPESACHEVDTDGLLTRFEIGGTTFEYNQDKNGYYDWDGNQYLNPSIKVSEGFSNHDYENNLMKMRVIFSVENITADGLEIIQLDFSSRLVDDTSNNQDLYSRLAKSGYPFYTGNSAGIPKNISGNKLLFNNEVLFGEVDGGLYSTHYYLSGKQAISNEYPYYRGDNPATQVGEYSWDSNTNSGVIVAEDDPHSAYEVNTLYFTTIIVAKNYLGSGKDYVLAVYRWGFTNKGQTPIHSPIPEFDSGVLNPVELQTIFQFYPQYQLYNY
jgi:RHS repeat-associated protein